MRICYAWLPEFGVVYMVLVFAKNVQVNLDNEQKAACRTMLAEMHLALARARRGL